MANGRKKYICIEIEKPYLQAIFTVALEVRPWKRPKTAPGKKTLTETNMYVRYTKINGLCVKNGSRNKIWEVI